jgi:hypothetical protein
MSRTWRTLLGLVSGFGAGVAYAAFQLFQSGTWQTLPGIYLAARLVGSGLPWMIIGALAGFFSLPTAKEKRKDQIENFQLAQQG